MNREFRFRVWDVGKMFSKATVDTDVNPAIHDEEQWLECMEKAVVMQFTGLKDKNGVDIYEGDILHRISPFTDKLDVIVEVYFDQSKSGFCVRGKKLHGNPSLGQFLGSFQDDAGFYIAGNIYESPEQLELDQGE